MRLRGSAPVLVFAVVMAAAPGSSCKSGDGDEPAPTNIDAIVPHTPNGLRVLYAVPNGEWATAILHDPGLSDPITGWGNCMEQVRRCYRSTSGPIRGCVAGITSAPAPARRVVDIALPRVCMWGEALKNFTPLNDEGSV